MLIQSAAEEVAALLAKKGMITEKQRKWALEAHDRTGSTVTTILIAAGLVHRLTMYQVLAEMVRVPFIDLTENSPDPGPLAIG